jgi:hypothetical protein
MWQASNRLYYLVIGNGTDLAELLGHDQVWSKLCEQFPIYVVEAMSIGSQLAAYRLIDLAAG